MKTTVNGVEREFDPDLHDTAVDVLRDGLDLTGTKMVCGAGVCGACTVLLDGEPVCSCLVPAARLEGRQVRTVEAHGTDDLHPVQRALVMHEGLQCGYCTPGFVQSAIAFHDRWRAEHGTERPDREAVAEALAGNICRCGAYPGIHEGVAAACEGRYDADEPVSPVRIDALPRVTGEARYTTDIKRPGMLHAAIVRSTEAHAEVLSVDCAKALDVEGVVAARQVLAGNEVHHVGKPVAAVVARDRRTAKRAARLIAVTYEPLPALIDPREARKADAVASLRKAAASTTGSSFPGRWDGNVRTNYVNLTNNKAGRARKRIAQASAEGSDRLIETTFRSAEHAHTPLEPHGCVAEWNGGKLTVWASCQAASVWRDEIADERGLKREDVEVVATFVGGGFGSKAELIPEALFAVDLAKETGRPVSLILDRQEVIGYAGHRGGAEADVALLAGDEGELAGLRMDVYEHLGLGVDGITSTVMGLSYETSPQALASHDVVTNTPMSKAFRGPGGISGAFMLESAVDEMAWKLGRDPLDLRRAWDPHEHDRAVYDRLAALPEWQDRAPRPAASNGTVKRGIGTAKGHWMYLYNRKTRMRCEIDRDGIRIVSGVQEQGQGTRSVLAQAVAEVTGWEITDPRIRIEIGTSHENVSPVSGGSQVSASVYGPARDAVREAAKKLGADEAGFDWDAALAKLDEPVVAEVTRGRDDKIGGWKGLLDLDGRGLSLGHKPSTMGITTEVEVDTETGTVRVTRAWASVAAGRMFVPETAESQIRGGIIMGVGYTLFEERQVDMATGHILTINLDDCRLATIADVPEIDVHFEDGGFEHTASGGVGIGEVSMVPVAASIANAVYHATGFRPRAVPIRPEHIVEGLRMPEAAE